MKNMETNMVESTKNEEIKCMTMENEIKELKKEMALDLEKRLEEKNNQKKNWKKILKTLDKLLKLRLLICKIKSENSSWFV